MRLYSTAIYVLIGSLLLSLSACGTGVVNEDEGISGTYFFVQHDCEDDGNHLTIAQEGSNLTFQDGFNSAPSPYFGSIDADGNITFTNGDGDCEAIIDDQGIFVGVCHYPTEDCEFFYTPPIF